MKKFLFLTLSIFLLFLPITLFAEDINSTLSYKNIKDEFSQTVGKMISVKEGSFHWKDNIEKAVYLTPYLISETEITQRAYFEVMGENPSYFTNPDKSSFYANSYKPFNRINTDNRPVENIKFLDAIKFCNSLSLKEGFEKVYSIDGDIVSIDENKNGYRLPTEAQWVWAAMSCSDSPYLEYSGREKATKKESGDYVWFRENCYEGNPWELFKQPDFGTKKVKSKAPNSLGLYDMSGNVWEWVFDSYAEDGKREVGKNPICNSNSLYRVLKGGSWLSGANYITIDYRKKVLSDFSNYLIGFRVVRVLN